MTNTQTHIRQRYKYTNTHATTIQIQKHACDKDTNKETHMRQGYKYTLQIHKYQTCVRHGVCGQHFWANILSIPFTKYMTRCAVHLTYQNHHYGISARYGVASKKCWSMFSNENGCHWWKCHWQGRETNITERGIWFEPTPIHFRETLSKKNCSICPVSATPLLPHYWLKMPIRTKSGTVWDRVCWERRVTGSVDQWVGVGGRCGWLSGGRGSPPWKAEPPSLHWRLPCFWDFQS